MEQEARYLYSVIGTDIQESLGEIGIEKKEVFIIPYKDIAAVVHSCIAEPYDTKDRARAEEWILEHSYVIDQSMKKFGSVLPFSFDVILKGDDIAISMWLEKNYDVLHRDLKKVDGKAEYGIQIYYNYNDLANKILEEDPDLKEIKGRIEKQSKGMAYLLQKKLDQKLKSLTAQRAAELSNQTLKKIKNMAAEIKIDDKNRKSDDFKGLSLLASFNCLVSNENVGQLGETLEEINRLGGFRVRFTGPWAPFSFVDYRDLS